MKLIILFLVLQTVSAFANRDYSLISKTILPKCFNKIYSIHYKAYNSEVEHTPHSTEYEALLWAEKRSETIVKHYQQGQIFAKAANLDIHSRPIWSCSISCLLTGSYVTYDLGNSDDVFHFYYGYSATAGLKLLALQHLTKTNKSQFHMVCEE